MLKLAMQHVDVLKVRQVIYSKIQGQLWEWPVDDERICEESIQSTTFLVCSVRGTL
jgi:hypothetical protein